MIRNTSRKLLKRTFDLRLSFDASHKNISKITINDFLMQTSIFRQIYLKSPLYRSLIRLLKMTVSHELEQNNEARMEKSLSSTKHFNI